MLGRSLLAVMLSTFVCLAAIFLTDVRAGSARLAPGTLLIASDRLGDPNFAESVVLIIRRDDDEGTLGLVLNRPADVTLAKAFPHLHATSDPVYEGGPVAPDAVQALLRSSSKPEDAELVVGNIYSVARKARLEKSIASRLPAADFRVYLGYAGWGPGQLENEIRQGAWSTAYGAKYVFDGEPDSLWQRLNRDSQSQVADRKGTDRSVHAAVSQAIRLLSVGTEKSVPLRLASALGAHATMEACRRFAPLF